MRGIILQILYASRRDALFLGTTFFVLLCTAISCFLGMNASVEAQQARVVYTAGMSRIAIMVGFIIFVVFYIKRMFENHEIEVILSHSISRTQIILGLFFGFTITLLTLVSPAVLILLALQVSIKSLLVWAISLILEGLIMLTFTICCALIVKSQVHSLIACVATYIVGRTIGGFVAYITLSIHFSWYSIVSSILKLASIFIPRFDLFGKTSWLIYNDYSISEITLFLMQSIVFIGIFMCISIIDFRKKEF